jgi:carboxymethylenebutenolidase
MERLKASDFPQQVLQLFDGYVHGVLDRRGFLDGAARYAVGGFTAAAMLEALRPNFALAEQVAKNDARIKAEIVEYDSPQGSGKMKGYLARPAKAGGKLPAIVVFHENRGKNPYTDDVVRRLAVEGYLAFAPDALSPLGGYPGDEEKAAKMFATLDTAKRIEDMVAAANFVKTHAESNGRLGATGFCNGGTVCNLLVTRMPDLLAAAPYYGGPAPAAEVAKIKAALLVHHAGLDERLLATWPTYEAALKAHNVRYEGHIYPNVHHGFHNDTTPRYDEAAAKLSWQRTLDLFAKHVKG